MTTAVHDGGDHTIVVGQVTAVAFPALTDRSSSGPLVHYSGAYRRLDSAAPSDPANPLTRAP